MKQVALKYSVLYLVMGTLLVIGSSYLATELVSTTSSPLIGEIVRGIFLIAPSSFLLYLIIIQASKTLSSKKNQYKRLFEDNPNPMWVYDVETLKVLAVNQAAIQTYGYTHEEFLRLSILQLRPGSEYSKLLQNLKQESSSYSNSGNWLHMRKNGETFYASIFSHRTQFNNRRARLVLALDINDRLLAERRILVQNERLKEIAHMQSHNVRRPVASIMGLVNLFDKHNPSSEMNGIVLEKIDVVCKELDDTIHNIVEKTYELEVEDQP